MNEYNEAVAKAVSVLAATFAVEADAMLTEAYSIGLRSLTPAEIEQATGVALQQSKWMPKPCELIEYAQTRGTSYEVQAVVAFEELDRALHWNEPKSLSPLVAAITRQIGGFAALREIPINEFFTWKRKDFLAAHIVLSKENPDRLSAITSEQSELVQALQLKRVETREQLQEREQANRQKLLEALQ